MSKTIIVSNRLPVKIERNQAGEFEYKTSEGGLATGLGSVYKEGDNIWVGWPGLAVNKTEDKEEICSRLKESNMSPVFLTKNEIEEYYEGFSNETLWPNFHYFNQYAVYSDAFWNTYKKVNKKFAKKLEEIIEDGDKIWIHDYQLLVLPAMIRETHPNSSIGFFLHIPFPSYESFRLLPWRTDLLTGMLGADFIGFHTYDYVRHFLSSVNRLVGITDNDGHMNVGNRLAMADAIPMGIDYNRYAQAAADPETLASEVKYRISLGDVKLILSIDRLDYSKGIPQRLRAFEQFIEENEEFREEVSLLILVVPSRDQVPMYANLKKEIELLVGSINGKFGTINWRPIHYFYRSYPLHSLSAFYRMSHVALVTPLRDGMNLVCKEFVASKLDKKGVLILSETAGSAKELSDAILINPNDTNQMVEAMKEALKMPEEEQIARMETMQKSLKRYDINAWVKLFMKGLEQVKEEQENLRTKPISSVVKNKLLQEYRSSKKRIIFLDYDGTLVGFYANPNDSVPDAELEELMTKLTADTNNQVVVISGRGRDFLEKWLSKFNVDFIAEHGVWHKENGKEWECFVELDTSWQEEFDRVLEMYVDRTPGSFIERKDFSMVWHYRKVEPGLGELRSRELANLLKYLSADKDLQVQEGDMVIEIKNARVNKGVAAASWLKKNDYDFSFACGDDWTDEDTFKAMPEDAFTVKVGSSSSAAKYRVENFKDIRKLLLSLANQ
ncbi:MULTISPECIES: bifunctional alpha,alpha-trehalose-phosphate synthase (UDP-forming)/trehalose-phosphatase [Crocosphaera]|uniref:Alpha,alpha-trehalose-phosphate synthase n=5 Tax=Crocosphaera TaxID=263510 RepID=G5J897_CROWT|nr:MULTISPECIES: bifunctional alpha,alpha-trehalose-phosphate synthase (UDP-forming)/trehalose-phosphatase [Crocosphaera]EHJ11581.1 Alpha,alpha-trehalose-phosphate synthase [UDP-forming] / Trehalose-6-phosphate phosphatase [Crocosphaera watsonii WH 0003]MCH2243810.1 bifunctional alpha,alpha-trehalose-phosphate synthase (UDP-forming)/trehalose-phosphatase [Crocosphaera sp.]CCQ53234.1 Alpha,alpha-trehalose-phosphate synthase [UDP-forming] / Trehalose-6-phosphate phosphatase [Crocosphaera watsonii 